MNTKNVTYLSRWWALFFLPVITFIFFVVAGYGWEFYKKEIDLFCAADKVQSWRDILTFFLDGNASGNAHPSNYVAPPLTVFSSFYRPLLFVSAYVQYIFLGMRPYLHYVISIVFHCCTIPVMYIWLTRWVSSAIAAAACTLLALHPAWALWIGSPNMQQYTVNTLLIVLIALSAHNFVFKKRWYDLLAVAGVSIVSIFYRETMVVAPFFVVMLAMGLSAHRRALVVLAAVLSLISAGYVACKLFLYPLSAPGAVSSSFTNMHHSIVSFVGQVKLFISDFCALSWFPQGYPLLKGFVLVAMLGATFLLWRRSFYKRQLGYAALGMFFLLWPAFLIGYFSPSRYFYEASPAYFLFVGLLFKGQGRRVVRWGSIVFFMCMSGSLVYTWHTIHERKKAPALFAAALAPLRNNEVIKHNALCFVGFPPHLCSTGIAQQMWLYRMNDYHPIYVVDTMEQAAEYDAVLIGWDDEKCRFFSGKM